MILLALVVSQDSEMLVYLLNAAQRFDRLGWHWACMMAVPLGVAPLQADAPYGFEHQALCYALFLTHPLQSYVVVVEVDAGAETVRLQLSVERSPPAVVGLLRCRL